MPSTCPAGTGTSVDWAVTRTIRDRIRLPLMLACGLHADNAGQAVAAMRPYGVEVISGGGKQHRRQGSGHGESAHPGRYALAPVSTVKPDAPFCKNPGFYASCILCQVDKRNVWYAIIPSSSHYWIEAEHCAAFSKPLRRYWSAGPFATKCRAIIKTRNHEEPSMPESIDVRNNSGSAVEHTTANQKLKRLEWMLSGRPISDIEARTETHDQGYGDLTQLNRDGMILKSIGPERLAIFANDYLELLGTSSAIYEVDGDYALGIFSSGWCRMMDRASRNLCDTADNAEALDSGRWLCHESCWTACSKPAIAECAPKDIACNGGIRMYAVPILVHGNVVGAINFGYGDPPKDPEKLRQLAEAYHLDCDDLVGAANAYESRPPFIIELAKKRLHATARLIGAMIEIEQAEEALRKSEETLRATLHSIGDAVISTDMEGLVVAMNPVAEALTGWSDKEAAGQPIETVFRIINEQNRQPVESPVSNVLKTGHVVGLANHTLLLAKDGREVPIADSGSPIRNDAGEITGVVLVFRDQTEERNTLQALASNYALLQIAGETALFGGWTVDLENNICTWSDAVADIHDVPRGYAPPVHDAMRFYAPEWREKIKQVFSACANEGIPYDEDMEIVTRNGKRVWVRAIGRAVRNQEGNIIKVQGSFQDITERKKAEEKLKEKTQLLQVITDNMFDLVALTDLEGNYIFLGASHHILGYDIDFLIGRNVMEFVHPEDVDELSISFRDFLSGSDDSRKEEYRYRCADGRYVWFETVGKFIRDDSGDPKEIIFSTRDITEHKRIERELKESEERFRALHNASFGGIVIHDKGLILECNQGLSEITGYGYDELIGMDGLSLISDGTRDKVVRNINAGYEKPYEAEGVRKDGGTYPLRLEARGIRYKGKDVRVVEFRDISENKRAEKEKENLEAQLHQAQRMESVGRLAGGVAHDYNNMLSVISGYTEMALERLQPGDPLHSDLTEVYKAAARSTDITRQLLAFARKQTITPKVIDLNAIVESMLQMLRRLIGEDIDLAWLPGKRLWAVKIDPSQIDQILANLCVNARDAIAGVGKVTIETGNITIDNAYCEVHSGFLPGEYLLLAVSDNGCGMDDAIKENIFDPFFTTKGVAEGTGLGLATVYGIVKQNDGFINVYSEPGEGTTIRIYLPRHVGDAPRSTAATKPQTPGGKGETVLLVEDEPSILQMAEIMLQRLGYHVVAAGTPGQALALAEQKAGRIDLLITDVVMPAMSGRMLADQIRSLCPEIETLFMSGYTANVIAHNGVLDEGVNFIQKPFSLHDLGIKVRMVLDEK
ncbi:PAS domain S-box protein [Desulfatitalea alkaliphila]|uniref:histidine kinase n=1 Tax=Desulfatitalea alkaliphila TaxID=2929485 RepID=A0AA41R3X6_9BACT|nr:PAS domain S-box protein [Desulfatitalea alkaliphila]MCJ8501547.1 PAS domain S-box protein [Desulfatitalea alkaliphila]